MASTTTSSSFTNTSGHSSKGPSKSHLSKQEAKRILEIDYSTNFPESVQDLVKKLYSRRNEKGEAVETISQTWRRVALGVAIARLKYVLKPYEIIQLTLERALEHEAVLNAGSRYYQAMGTRKMFANTPCNINASPEISLCVLQYEAHGEILNWSTNKIWMNEPELRHKYESLARGEKEKVKKWISEVKGINTGGTYSGQQKLFYPNVIETVKHELAMGYYASKIRRRGGLAACGVTYAGDSLEEIERAANEIMDATKGSMGMGINTSSLRPWQTPNSDGSTASGPDRFVEKLFCPAGQSIAQGGRRGGAFIELRDSDHPDITFFLIKKQLPKEPSLPDIYDKLNLALPEIDPGEYIDSSEYERAVKERNLEVMKKALEEFSRASFEYFDKQQYLKNYNISVRATHGFMNYVENKEWYPASFAGMPWKGNLFDFSKPLFDEQGNQRVNPLNKEPLFQLYSVNLEEFPEAEEAAVRQGLTVLKSDYGNLIQVKQDGTYCFYAPDIFKRICVGMVNGGEPGLQFADNVERSNANSHIYELNTCNPCGEQNLPACVGKDGLEYRGVCNLTTIHAAHKDFWDENGNYNFEKMQEVAELATEFMDDVTTVTHFPIPAQNSTARRERRNGGGFAGIAEFLVRQELELGSEEANKAVTTLYNYFAEACLRASKRLQEERGVYEIWPGSSFAKKGIKVRNSCMINQQPTGTMAQLCGTSWGLEPFNGIVFGRKVRDAWIRFTAPGFEDAMKKQGAWPETNEEIERLCEKISKNGKRVTGLAEVPHDVQRIFKINTEIDPLDYVKHLAAVQSGDGGFPECFNAVSNTCVIKPNMPWEYAWDAALLAHKLGLKSITFYPDSSRITQPVEEQEKKEKEVKKLEKFIPTRPETRLTKGSVREEEDAHEGRGQLFEEEKKSQAKPRMRPKKLYGFNEEVLTPEGPLYIHVYFDSKGPRQVFAHLTRGGGVTSGMIEAICRMVTKALKWGCPPEDIADGLINIQGGPRLVGIEACSIPDAIGRVLKEACKGQYQMSLFDSSPDTLSYGKEDHVPVQTTFQEKHEITFENKIQDLDDKVRARMEWIAEGHMAHCPCCHAEFTADSFGNPACKTGPVCLSCGWSHCG